MSDSGSADETVSAVVLDILRHGRADDDRPQYERQPLSYVLEEDDFRLLELSIDGDADIGIGDRIVIEPAEEREDVHAVQEVSYEGLSSGARSELEYAVEEIIDADPERFVDFYNDAQPITLRLHQLNLLPGIGKKLRNSILDQRERKPFDGFEELTERVSGLHNPRQVLVDRILEELRDENLKYRTFVRRE